MIGLPAVVRDPEPTLAEHEAEKLADAERAAGQERPHKYVHMTFEPREIKIDHYAPAGYRLLWVLALEDHDPEDPIFSPEAAVQ